MTFTLYVQILMWMYKVYKLLTPTQNTAPEVPEHLGAAAQVLLQRTVWEK